MKGALITGACGALGRELVREFMRNRVYVVMHCNTGVHPELEMGSSGCFFRGDLTEEDTLARLAELVRERKEIDILINNAGLYQASSLTELEPGVLRQVIEVNLVAPILLTRKLWPIFVQRKAGLVVNVNSLSGKSGGPREFAYSASKAGLRAFTESLQYEATQHEGLRVLSVFVGAMKSKMTEGRSGADDAIEPKEVAKVIFGLCQTHESLRMTEVEIKRAKY